jgi:hypothetical protein
MRYWVIRNKETNSITTPWQGHKLLDDNNIWEHSSEAAIVCIYGKGKGKAIPLQALTDPEGSGRLRLPDFKTIGT